MVVPVVPAPWLHATIATRRLPAGGVKLAVVTVVAEKVSTTAGDDPSSVIVPEARISSRATLLTLPIGALAPTVIAPGVPVALVVRPVP
jgi:hypothetical protein